jgi:hypothetical protein
VAVAGAEAGLGAEKVAGCSSFDSVWAIRSLQDFIARMSRHLQGPAGTLEVAEEVATAEGCSQ